MWCRLVVYLYETFIETKIVSDGVLPTLAVILVVREVLRYILVDTVQG